MPLADESDTAAIRVVHITGTGRSGSTLVARLLGSVPGVFAAGEVRFLWERGLAPGARCGCHLLVRECPVWSGVLARIDPGEDQAGALAFHERLRAAVRLRRAGRWLAVRRHRLTGDERPLRAELLDTYRAISESSDADLIVDSSKLPNYAALLDAIPELDVYVLHLVRDPRAAAWSWSRTSASQEVRGFEERMDQMSSVKSSLLWLVWNGLTAWRFGRRSSRDRYLRMRYEDLMDRPREGAERIAEFLGVDPAQLPFVDETMAELAPTHVVAGNPNRMGSSQVTFNLDRRWEAAMSARDKATVATITAPLLTRFGYARRSA